MNLYGFVGNDGLGKWDLLGMHCWDCDALYESEMLIAREYNSSALNDAHEDLANYISNIAAEQTSCNKNCAELWDPIGNPFMYNWCMMGCSELAAIAQTGAYLSNNIVIAAIQLTTAGLEDQAHTNYVRCVKTWGADSKGCPCSPHIPPYPPYL
jgi:hypothetical protein